NRCQLATATDAGAVAANTASRPCKQMFRLLAQKPNGGGSIGGNRPIPSRMSSGSNPEKPSKPPSASQGVHTSWSLQTSRRHLICLPLTSTGGSHGTSSCSQTCCVVHRWHWLPSRRAFLSVPTPAVSS